MAVTMNVFYKEPPDREKFDKHFFEAHLPLVKKVPGVQKMEIKRFTSKGSPYYLMVTFYFSDKDARKAALSTPENQATADDLPNYAAPDSYVVAFADVVES